MKLETASKVASSATVPMDIPVMKAGVECHFHLIASTCNLISTCGSAGGPSLRLTPLPSYLQTLSPTLSSMSFLIFITVLLTYRLLYVVATRVPHDDPRIQYFPDACDTPCAEVCDKAWYAYLHPENLAADNLLSPQVNIMSVRWYHIPSGKKPECVCNVLIPKQRYSLVHSPYK